MKKPRVLISILNWNKSLATLACVESLERELAGSKRSCDNRLHQASASRRSAMRGQHRVLTSSRPAHMNPSTSGVIAPVVWCGK